MAQVTADTSETEMDADVDVVVAGAAERCSDRVFGEPGIIPEQTDEPPSAPSLSPLSSFGRRVTDTVVDFLVDVVVGGSVT